MQSAVKKRQKPLGKSFSEKQKGRDFSRPACFLIAAI
jgi:hypothetical protein